MPDPSPLGLEIPFLTLIFFLSSTPQEAFSSPTLSNVYVNDIPRKPRVKLAKFANDTEIIFRDNNPKYVIEILQEYLNEYSDRLKKWRIKVNLRNSAAVLFILKHFTLL